jgi:Leucine-rich repeat (LRR) protein
LGCNELTGPICAELGKLTALTMLDLGGNQLTGLIPAELGQLGALTHLWLSNNQLSGPIPAELGQLVALTTLYLCGRHNQLTGQEAFREYMEEHNPDCDLELAPDWG